MEDIPTGLTMMRTLQGGDLAGTGEAASTRLPRPPLAGAYRCRASLDGAEAQPNLTVGQCGRLWVAGRCGSSENPCAAEHGLTSARAAAATVGAMLLRQWFSRPWSWMQRLSDFAFGHDFFISYRRDDGRNLPRSLAAKLAQSGFRVFLDEKVYVAGDDLPRATQRRIGMSTYLVLVARPGAMCRSPWVATEVALSSHAGKRLVVLDVDGAFTGTVGATPEEAERAETLRRVIDQRIRIPLDSGCSEGIFDGDVPEAVLDDIRRSFTATRQDTRRAVFFSAASVAFAVLAGVAVFLGWQADSARRQAQAQAAVASAGALAARSDATRSERPQLAALLARAAVTATTQRGEPPTPTARQALHDSVLALSGDAIAGSSGPARVLASHATGTRLASASGRRLAWWDVPMPGRFERSRELDAPGDIAFVGFGAGDRWLAAGGSDFICFVRLDGDGKDACQALGAGVSLLEGIFSPDGRYLVGIRHGSTVVAWDLGAADAAGSLRVLGRGLHTVREARFSSDGQWLLAWGITNPALWLWTREQVDRGGPPAVLMGHRAPIKTADVSGRAGLVVSADDDGHVKLWRLSPSPARATPLLSGDAGQWTTSVAFSADGRWLGVPRRLGLPDDTPATDLMLYRVDGRDVTLHARLAHDSYTDRFAFDPTSRFLLALGTNGTNWLWDLQGRFDERQSRLVAHEWPVDVFAFSADGTRLVTSDRVGRSYWWALDCHRGRPVAQPLRGLEGPVAALRFASAGRWLAGSDQRNLRQWDAALPVPGEPLVMADDCGANIDEVITSPSGRWLATAGRSGVALFDAASARPFARTELLNGALQAEALRLSGDDRWLALCLKGGAVLVWDLALTPAGSGQPRRLPAAGTSCRFMDFSHSGLLLTSDVSGVGSLWNLGADSLEKGRVVLGGPGRGIPRIAPDGRYVVALDYDALVMWDRRSSPAVPAYAVLHRPPERPRDAVFSLDGRWLLVRAEDQAWLWDLSALPKGPAKSFALRRGHWLDAGFGGAGRWLFVPTPEAFELWDLGAPSAPRGPFRLPAAPERAARSAFDRTGRWFMTGEGSTIHLWDLAEPGRAPAVLETGGGEIESLVFSPDGRALAFGTRNGGVGSREIAAGAEQGFVVSRLQTGSVRGLVFSADSRWFASATYSSVRLWPTGVDQLLTLGAQRIGREAEPAETRFYLKP